MHELIKRVNWVDLVALILLIRIIYVSSYIGVGKQLLPLALLVLTLLLSLYTYTGIGDCLVTYLSLPESISNFFSYLFIVLILIMLYKLAMRLTGVKAQSEEVEAGNIEKTGGALVGLLRSIIIIGMVCIGLLLMPTRFTERSVKSSFLGGFFVHINLRLYSIAAKTVFRSDATAAIGAATKMLDKKDRYYFESSNLKGRSRFFNRKDS